VTAVKLISKKQLLKMNTKNNNQFGYRLTRSGLYGKDVFVKTAENGELEIEQVFNSQDMFMSTCLFSDADIISDKIYNLYFCVESADIGQTQENIILACYYISENFAIPTDCIEVIYNGADYCGDAFSDDSVCKEDSNNNTLCEMVIIIPPVVYGNRQFPYTSAINYHLARQMLKDGIKNIQIDVYEHNHMIRVPNSFNTSSKRFVIPLRFEEILHMGKSQIITLSKAPRPENSMIIPKMVPEAIEWFACRHEEFAKKQKSQNRLLELILKDGWQIPPCIRRLQTLCLYDSIRLEAYRIIAQFYSWIKASVNEIWQQVQNSDHRNPINNYSKLNAIIKFAIENPSFAGCSHKLLKRFCPVGKCFIDELINLNKEPLLFEKSHKRRW